MFKKKLDIMNYSNKDIEDIANWMNNYPRKIFGYKTPIEMIANYLTKLLIYKKNLMLYNNIKLNKCMFYMFTCCTSFENL